MNRIKVLYQGQTVGVLAEALGGIVFEYDAAFIASGHQLSPLHLPLIASLYMRDKSPGMRLPGVFEDSLPDAWGERLMLEWFRRQGTARHAVTPLMKLAYVGHRGMGALTYEPELCAATTSDSLSLNALYQAAAHAEARSGEIDLDLLAQLGSSAGGAHPKALIGLARDGSEKVILAGADDLTATHEGWIVKFDTSSDGMTGPMEHAYALMARAAGIDMPTTRLLETCKDTTVRRHFAVKRFDRNGTERIHHHSLAGVYHMGGGDLSYETFLGVTRRLTLDEREVWRAYRRAVFNVLASNRDDHGKNHGFLYRDRQWKLGPAYDVTFRGSRQLPERGMSIGGERMAAGVDHLLKLAKLQNFQQSETLQVIEEVNEAIGGWKKFAEEAGVAAKYADEVSSYFIRPR